MKLKKLLKAFDRHLEISIYDRNNEYLFTAYKNEIKGEFRKTKVRNVKIWSYNCLDIYTDYEI